MKRFTLLLIPDANRAIVQTQFTRSFIVSLVLLVVTAICFIVIGITSTRSAYVNRIRQLNESLSEERQQAAIEIRTSSQTIDHLQREVTQLANKADTVEKKLQELEQLEYEIRSLTDASEKNSDSVSILEDKGDIGGASISLDHLDNQMNTLTDRMESIQILLSEMASIMKVTPSIWPTSTHTITSRFGVRRDPFTRKSALHNGIDIDGNSGDPIVSTADGTVIELGWDQSYGNYIVIEHTQELQSVYMHLQRILVEQDEAIEKGQQIGLMGSTGRSTGSHLHYEVHVDGSPVNPQPYLEMYNKEG
jgi:murein DD-endopeptidase MepM/ murein hydrolase activator NlpD